MDLVSKVMSLPFNMLSRFVIAFLPRSKCLLISSLQSPYAVIFGAQENKICHCFHCFLIYLPWSDGTRCHDLRFLNIQDWFPSGLTGLISIQPKTLKSLLQHHSSKASILRCSVFFMVQLSYLCITTRKKSLSVWTIVGKVMSAF